MTRTELERLLLVALTDCRVVVSKSLIARLAERLDELIVEHDGQPGNRESQGSGTPAAPTPDPTLGVRP